LRNTSKTVEEQAGKGLADFRQNKWERICCGIKTCFYRYWETVCRDNPSYFQGIPYLRDLKFL
jgi:hypothetical protein